MKSAEIGEQLRKARSSARLTQAKLALRMGTTQSAVARAESGWVQPSLDFIERFVRETGQALRLGSLIVLPAVRPKDSPDERAERVRRAIGDYEFNPWLRNPTRSERKSLESDGLTREYFERQSPSRAGKR